MAVTMFNFKFNHLIDICGLSYGFYSQNSIIITVYIATGVITHNIMVTFSKNIIDYTNSGRLAISDAKACWKMVSDSFFKENS